MAPSKYSPSGLGASSGDGFCDVTVAAVVDELSVAPTGLRVGGGLTGLAGLGVADGLRGLRGLRVASGVAGLAGL